MSMLLWNFPLRIRWKLNFYPILTVENCHIFKIIIKMSHKQILKEGENKM